MSEPHFEIQKVDMQTWTWALVEGDEVLALAPKGYDTKQRAEVAIIRMTHAAEEAEAPK